MESFLLINSGKYEYNDNVAKLDYCQPPCSAYSENKNNHAL